MTDPGSSYHVPVLAERVLEAAGDARRVVDATLGGGGHSALFRERGMEVLAIDRDPDALRAARARLGEQGITYHEGAYGDDEALEAVARFHPDFILMDLGVSSHQLDREERGFSFRPGAPLDMRMGQAGETAADFLNDSSEPTLRAVFADYGDEPRAAALAREVVRRRQHQPFATSDHLVNAIRGVLGPRSGPSDFARLFQAVRIAVNDELEGLGRALPAFREALTPGGRLAVISYHSGEDRLVKHSMQEWSRSCVCPPGTPLCTCRGRALGRLEPRKPIRPDANEIAHNPRARSATLRIFLKAI